MMEILKLGQVEKFRFADTPIDIPPRPENLTIGSFVWSVRDLTKIEELEHGVIGLCDTINLEIAVKPDMPPQRQAETMMHEILHACFRAGDLNEDEHTSEEKVVSVLSMQIMQTMRDNPDLRAWLAACSDWG